MLRRAARHSRAFSTALLSTPVNWIYMLSWTMLDERVLARLSTARLLKKAFGVASYMFRYLICKKLSIIVFAGINFLSVIIFTFYRRKILSFLEFWEWHIKLNSTIQDLPSSPFPVRHYIPLSETKPLLVDITLLPCRNRFTLRHVFL